MEFSSIEFRLHAVQRMFERGIRVIDVKEKPLHVIVAIDPNTKKAIIITVYEPDPNLWQEGSERRK